MDAMTIALLITLALLAVCIWAVGALRKRPGLRRRREDPKYDGPPRRMTDCSREIEDAFQAVNNETKVEKGVKMKPSTPRKKAAK